MPYRGKDRIVKARGIKIKHRQGGLNKAGKRNDSKKGENHASVVSVHFKTVIVLSIVITLLEANLLL